MRIWFLSLIGLVAAPACTANDGTPRSDFYRTVVGTGGTPSSALACEPACATGQRCFSGQCYAIVTCTDSLDCTSNAPAPLTICDSATGQCVVCVSDADCTSVGRGTRCVNNDCI